MDARAFSRAEFDFSETDVYTCSVNSTGRHISNPALHMKTPNDEMTALVVTAATLRAGGIRWKDIAKGLKRSPGTVRRWPEYFRDAWNRAFAAEEERLIAEAAAEARLVLRAMLGARISPH